MTNINERPFQPLCLFHRVGVPLFIRMFFNLFYLPLLVVRNQLLDRRPAACVRISLRMRLSMWLRFKWIIRGTTGIWINKMWNQFQRDMNSLRTKPLLCKRQSGNGSNAAMTVNALNKFLWFDVHCCDSHNQNAPWKLRSKIIKSWRFKYGHAAGKACSEFIQENVIRKHFSMCTKDESRLDNKVERCKRSLECCCATHTATWLDHAVTVKGKF